jgi:hypothetical protein
VKRTLLLQFLLWRSPPDAAFASSGGHAVSLPAARGNASVRLMLEFVVVPANSVDFFLSVVVGCLCPARTAAGWQVTLAVSAAVAVAGVRRPGPIPGGRRCSDGRWRSLTQVPDAVGGGEGSGIRVVGCRQPLPDGLQHSE